MKPTDKPAKELAAAEAAVQRIKTAANLDELEVAWIEYLQRLDRVWNKLEAYYRRSGKWHNWNGRYKQERTKDPLLLYLRQARNAEEHRFEEIAAKEMGSWALKALPGVGSVHIKHLEIDSQGNLARLESDQPLLLEVTPSRLKLLSVKNYDVIYHPPNLHLGRPVDPQNILGIAEIGVTYYRRVIHEAEQHFATAQ